MSALSDHLNGLPEDAHVLREALAFIGDALDDLKRQQNPVVSVDVRPVVSHEELAEINALFDRLAVAGLLKLHGPASETGSI